MTRGQGQRIALVTGASRGIGRAISLELAKENMHVIALARTKGALESLDDEIQKIGGNCTLIPQDLENSQELESLGPALWDKFGRLDVFIANAGILGTLGPVAHASNEEVERVFRVNMLANQQLLRALDPLLRLSDKAFVVSVLTSPRTCRGRAYWGIYGASKAALQSLTVAYAQEVENTNISVFTFEPGAVRTSMRAKAVPGEDPHTIPAPEKAAEQLMKKLRN